MTPELRQDIEAIIDHMPHNRLFTAHTVIEYLIQNYSDHYLQACGSTTPTETYHSHISSAIRTIVDERENLGYIMLEHEAWSKNIHDEFSECKVYYKP